MYIYVCVCVVVSVYVGLCVVNVYVVWRVCMYTVTPSTDSVCSALKGWRLR